MKKIALILSLFICFSTFGQTSYLTCTSVANYQDGYASKNVFQIPFNNDVVIRTWQHNEYVINLAYEGEVPSFKLNITKDDVLLTEQDVTPDTDVVYSSSGFS